MALKLSNIMVLIGTLTHGYFECLSRSMMVGKRCWDCVYSLNHSTVVVERSKSCSCDCKQLLDQRARVAT